MILTLFAYLALVVASALLIVVFRSHRWFDPMFAPPVLLAGISAAAWAIGAGVMQLVPVLTVMYSAVGLQVFGAWGVVASYVWLAMTLTYRSHLLTTPMLLLAGLPPSSLVILLISPLTRDLLIRITLTDQGSAVQWGAAFWSATIAAALVMITVASVMLGLATQTVQGQRPLLLTAMATTLPAAVAWFFFIADHAGQKLAALSPTLLALAVGVWLLIASHHPHLIQLPITVDRLLAEVDDGVVILTPSGEVLDHNQAARLLVKIPGVWTHFSDAGLGEVPKPGTATSIKVRDNRVLELVTAQLALPGRATTLVVTIRDITELALLREHLTDVASRDPMTGARNRRFLDDRLANLVDRARNRFPLSIVMFDVDRFKAVNDTYGHTMGDRVIIGIADEVWSMIPAGAELVRMGGDEFALVLPGMDQLAAHRVADRLSTRCAELQFATHRQPVSVEVSTGVAELEPSMGPDELLRAADRSLYETKRAHRSVIKPDPATRIAHTGPIPVPDLPDLPDLRTPRHKTPDS